MKLSSISLIAAALASIAGSAIAAPPLTPLQQHVALAKHNQDARDAHGHAFFTNQNAQTVTGKHQKYQPKMDEHSAKYAEHGGASERHLASARERNPQPPHDFEGSVQKALKSQGKANASQNKASLDIQHATGGRHPYPDHYKN